VAFHTNSSSPNTHLNTTDPAKLHLPVTSNETHDKVVDKDASIDIITPPRPPAEPPPVVKALECQLENSNDDDSSTTDMSYLSNWLDQANKAEVDNEVVDDSNVTVAAERWSDSVVNKTTVSEEPLDTSFPKGSSLDRPPPKTSAINLTRHIYKDFNTPLTEEFMINPSVNRVNLDTSPTDLSPEGLDDVLEDYKNDTVVSICCRIRAIGLEGDATVLQTIEWNRQIAETFGTFLIHYLKIILRSIRRLTFDFDRTYHINTIKQHSTYLVASTPLHYYYYIQVQTSTRYILAVTSYQ